MKFFLNVPYIAWNLDYWETLTDLDLDHNSEFEFPLFFFGDDSEGLPILTV